MTPLRVAALLVVVGSLPPPARPATRPEAGATPLLVWRLQQGRMSGPEGSDAPLPVGSLAKPFVAKAWALRHRGVGTKLFRCASASGCWLASGHGALGLSKATLASCNTYFRALAAETEPSVLASVLRDEQFLVPSPLSADAAIGSDGALTIRPAALLRAYLRLTREPWAEGEGVRGEVLAGLRENAIRGTARGLGRYGLWAKTGTVPAIDGRPLRTSGLIVAVDDSGLAVLGVLPEGTGREAARALGALLEYPRKPTAGREGVVSGLGTQGAESGRVSAALFGELRPRVLIAHNLGDHPLETSRGFVGPGASATLRPGDRLSEGRWRVALPDRRFHRDVKATLRCDEGPAGTLRLRADMAAPEYVTGVLRAELPAGDQALRIALGAAVIRFLAAGPRHGATQVCDSTHCAWFVGLGPVVSWRTATLPVLSPPAAEEGADLGAATWEAMAKGAEEPGPRQWTSHCGGRPLSAHAVWGNGDQRVWACDRHPGSSAPWSRRWTDADLATAFGSRVRSLAVTEVDGTWRLAVATAAGTVALGYDDAHRRLATRLGWAALPSPATTVAREAGGWRAEGVGLGHRVGLCLGEDQRSTRAEAGEPRLVR